MTSAVTGRANQKARTRQAIVDACRELTRTGAEMTMPQVARAAMVSEATAYRYFPDLVTLLQEAIVGLWPPAPEALAPVADSTDPAERVAFACEYLMRGVHAYQGAVRAMIANTITTPTETHARPGIRFDLIDHAIAPCRDGIGPTALADLRQSLAIVISAEALFVLTDLCDHTIDDAITIAVRTATTLTTAAFARRH
jgi:AcrR family transcriptional regulator